MRGGLIRTGASSSGVQRAAPYRHPDQAVGQRPQAVRGDGATQTRTNTEPRQCFACGGVGHFRHNYPSLPPRANQVTGQVATNRPLQQQRLLQAQAPGGANQGRVFALTQLEEDASNAVVKRIILLYNSWARILFDPVATYSFIRTAYALNLGLGFEKLEHALNIDLPTGEQLGTKRVCRGYVLRIGEHELIVDLVALDIKGYDVIFEMNYLSTFRVVIDCFRKRISFHLPGRVVFTFMNDHNSSHLFPTTGSRFLKAKAGSQLSFLASLMGEDQERSQSGVVLIVSEFLDVFSDDLLGLPP